MQLHSLEIQAMDSQVSGLDSYDPWTFGMSGQEEHPTCTNSDISMWL